MDAGTMVFEDQSGNGRVVGNIPMFSRTLMSSVIFGAMTPADSRADLMAAIMGYLLYGLGVQEPGAPGSGEVVVGPNPVPAGRVARFAVPGWATRLTVLDVSGRTVAEHRVADGGAELALSPDLAPGTYLARAAGPDRAVSCPFVVVR